MQNQICQSCGLPLSEGNFGTNSNHSVNVEYCKFCFSEGDFTIPDLTLNIQIERLTELAVKKFGMPKEEVLQLAKTTLPNLKRWQ